MTRSPEIITEIRRWVDKAENDLRNAEYVLGMTHHCPTDTVCYHCQQCAEKYLKAFLVLFANPFPRTHDLVLLLNQAMKCADVGLHAADVQSLNRYSIEARYPGDWDPIDFQEATEALSKAIFIRNTIRALLPPKVFSESKE